MTSPVSSSSCLFIVHSDRLPRVLDWVTRTITPALKVPHPQYELIWDTFLYLAKLENRSNLASESAYEWCALIWKNRGSCKTWEDLLFLTLKVAFRPIHPEKCFFVPGLAHTQHHRELADAIFKSDRQEAIADLLCGLLVFTDEQITVKLTNVCMPYIADLHKNVTMPFSPRLRGLVLCSVQLIDREGVGEGGAGKFVGLLNHLRVGVRDMGQPWDERWTWILAQIIRSTEGVQYLAVQVWELLAELTTAHSRALRNMATCEPQITKFLLDAQEWEKLECWLGVAWMAWLPETDGGAENLKSATNLLFRRKPDAVRRLTKWMERWSENHRETIPVPFQEICEQAQTNPV